MLCWRGPAGFSGGERPTPGIGPQMLSMARRVTAGRLAWPAMPPRSLALLVWLATTLALGLSLAAFIGRVHQVEIAKAHQRASAAAATVEQSLLRAVEAIRSVQDLLDLRQHLLGQPGAGAVERHVRSMIVAGRFGLIQASVTDMQGVIVWGALPDSIGMSLADRPHVAIHLDGGDHGLVLGMPVIGRASQRWILQATLLVRDHSGEPVGVGTIAIDPLALSEELGRQVQGPGRLAFIRRRTDGALLARSLSPEVHLAQDTDLVHPLLEAARGSPAGVLEYRTAYGARPSIVAYRAPDGLAVIAAVAFDWWAEMGDFIRVAALATVVVLAIVGIGLYGALAWAAAQLRQRRLSLEATRDPLTGLLNRQALLQEAEAALREARAADGAISLLLCDLDHFKSVNDRHGHAAGDAILRDVAMALRQSTRDSDLVCRWGGEEMLVLLRNCDRADALGRAEAIRLGVAEMHRSRPGPVGKVTVSIGGAGFPQHGQGLEALVEVADAALYRAKRDGRDRTVFGPG